MLLLLQLNSMEQKQEHKKLLLSELRSNSLQIYKQCKIVA